MNDDKNNIADSVSMPYLIRKNGMWYAHNSSGYTSRAELAEIYTKEYAESHARNHKCVSAVPLNEIIKTADKLNPYIERMQAMQEALDQLKPKDCCCGETEQAWRLCPVHGKEQAR